MIELARVGRLAIEPLDGVRVLAHARVHHLERALSLHLQVLGEVHRPHAALAELLHHVIAVGDHRARQVALGVLATERAPVARAESLRDRVFGAAGRADLDVAHKCSTRSTRSPSSTRWPAFTARSAAHRDRDAVPASRVGHDEVAVVRPHFGVGPAHRLVIGEEPVALVAADQDVATGREVKRIAHRPVGAQLREHGNIGAGREGPKAAGLVRLRRMRAGIPEPSEPQELRADEHDVSVGEAVRCVEEEPRPVAGAEIAHPQLGVAERELRVDRRKVYVVAELDVAIRAPDDRLGAAHDECLLDSAPIIEEREPGAGFPLRRGARRCSACRARCASRPSSACPAVGTEREGRVDLAAAM